MDAGAIQEHLELLQFDLARPLLVMKAPKGILGCQTREPAKAMARLETAMVL